MPVSERAALAWELSIEAYELATAMTFSDDFRDLLIALSGAKARFIVVGGSAVAVHGRPRATKDLDVWVEPTIDNARRVFAALADFGAPEGDLSLEDLATPGVGARRR